MCAPNGLEWAKEDTELIFKKICDELVKIERLTKSGRAFWGYKDLLDEMKVFLNDEKATLKNYSDFDNLLERIQYNLSLEVGDGGIEKRIMSEDQEEYFFAMEELTRFLFETESVGKYVESIDYVLSKLLVGFEPNLLFTLRKVSIWMKELKGDNCINKFSGKLCLILNKYKTNYKIVGYKPSFYLFLISIAEVLKYWNVKDDAISFWLEMKNNSVFNNVKYFKID